MHGDFSNAFKRRPDVSRVLIQQGRVMLDSDANEQTDTTLHYLRGLAMDLIGYHGGLRDGFKILGNTLDSLTVNSGIYYVDGIRCENAIDDDPTAASTKVPLNEQPNYFPTKAEIAFLEKKDQDILIYLDVFERHISAAEDDTIREVALMGADTSSRAVVVWQVRMKNFKIDDYRKYLKTLPQEWAEDFYFPLNNELRHKNTIRARAVIKETMDPCTIAPDARYRGTENRLFRVEVHDPGASTADRDIPPTFKFSPDNGSIVFPAHAIKGRVVELESLGRDERTRIRKNDWVEIVDDEIAVMGRVYPLHQVIDVDESRSTVTLDTNPVASAGADEKKHPILRRWATAPRPINGAWTELADGVEVQFDDTNGLRSGDYWLIPTRTATGDVIWPRDDSGEPDLVPQHGVDHHYAPLAWIPANSTTPVDLRWLIQRSAKKAP